MIKSWLKYYSTGNFFSILNTNVTPLISFKGLRYLFLMKMPKNAQYSEGFSDTVADLSVLFYFSFPQSNEIYGPMTAHKTRDIRIHLLFILLIFHWIHWC